MARSYNRGSANSVRSDLARANIKGKNEDTSLDEDQQRDVAGVVKRSFTATDAIAKTFGLSANPKGQYPIAESFDNALELTKRTITQMKGSVPEQFLKDMAGAVVDTMELAYLKSAVEHRVAAAVRANGPENEAPMRAQLEKQIKEVATTLQETHRDLAVQMKGMGWPSGMITDKAMAAIRSSTGGSTPGSVFDRTARMAPERGGDTESILDSKRFRQEADKFYKEAIAAINA